jgi:hypothetical protein
MRRRASRLQRYLRAALESAFSPEPFTCDFDGDKCAVFSYINGSPRELGRLAKAQPDEVAVAKRTLTVAVVRVDSPAYRELVDGKGD